ncbi:hypothetical protein ES702_03082 [subsurface metagenome]
MLRIIILAVVILGLTLGFSSLALAGERVEFEELKLASVRQERVDVLAYTASGLDFVSEVIARLIKTGKPAVLFAEETKGALEVSFIEGMLGSNIDLVGGMTLKNDEPSNFVWGFQYTGLRGKSDGIWDIFSKLNPTVYNERGHWWLGAAFTWKE